MLLERRSAVSAVLAVVVVIVVIVAGAGVYVLLSTGNPNPTTSSSSSQSSQSSQTTSSQASSQSSTTQVSTTQSSTATSSTPVSSASSTTSSVSSSSSTGSTTTSSAASSTTTCTTVTTTTTGNAVPAFPWHTLFDSFSGMEVYYHGSSSGMDFNLTNHYQVLYMSATTFKVNVTLQSGSSTLYFTAWVLKNGTAVAVYYYGVGNYTGAQANTYMAFAMAGFIFQMIFTTDTLAQFTGSSLVHVVNMTDFMIGALMVHATNYAANSLPLVMQSCSGTTSLDRFALQTGTVAGRMLTVVTALDIKGTLSTSSGTADVDFALEVTWME